MNFHDYVEHVNNKKKDQEIYKHEKESPGQIVIDQHIVDGKIVANRVYLDGVYQGDVKIRRDDVKL
jgi:hypothetical protein